MAQHSQRLEFEDFPERSLTVMLFKDVTNSKELRDMVASGSLEPECSLANASLLPDLFVLHVAAHKALAAEAASALRTRTLHAELVFNLSGSKQIAQSLDRHGINAECRHVLAARFDATPDDEAALQQAVAGTPTSLAELPALLDAELLGKYLKVPREELEVGSLADAQLMRMAARDC